VPILVSESGATVKRRKRRNGFRRSGADRETRYTLEPQRDICITVLVFGHQDAIAQ
jgi:hypothetical protein